MAINFNNLNNTAGLSKPTKANSLSTAQSSAQDSAKKSVLEQTNKQGNSGESVQLSQNARQLQSVSEKIASMPSVNSEKVAQLKQAIAEGSYQVDSQRVASKLLGLEAQFK
jgi:negative regulator of flagellin synthesis FlgM